MGTCLRSGGTASKTRARTTLQAARRHLNAGRIAEAKTAFMKACAARAARAEAIVGLAECFFQREDHLSARLLADEAVRRGGGLRAHLVLGNSLYKLRDYRGATASWERVLEIDKGHREACRNLAAARARLRAKER